MARITTSCLAFAAIALAACGPTASGSDDDDDDSGGPDGGSLEVCTPGATEACYDGAAGTQGIGPCQGGMRTCRGDGLAWLPCTGQVIPVTEVCANQIDEDCNNVVDDVIDLDADGWNSCTGDCCELVSQCGQPERVNPAALEAPTADAPDAIAVDDDCDGMIDEPLAPSCDTALAVADTDAMHGAWAVGLCNAATTPAQSGVIQARWVRGNGSVAAASQQFGLFDSFGPNVAVREGASMLSLSSGRARRPADTGACGSYTCAGYGAGTPPSGFPQDSPSCLGGSNINDDIALELQMRAPSNAVGYSVDFAFYSFEYPEFVCTTWNDQFIIHVDPPPSGAVNGNIAFDSGMNPVSVNIAFFDVCTGCPDGTAALTGTGFDTWDDAGATKWLKTTAPVEPGSEFTIRFMIWDTGDNAWDSTVLIDNFQWILEGSPGVETNPVD
jgi:hypothetical protein